MPEDRIPADDWRAGGFGLYLHWPFCKAKCPYCDFNSHVAPQIDEARWQAAYLTEIDRLGAQTEGRVLQSVFFGGGTPSLMSPDLVDAILRRIRATWPMANDAEITLEANPTSVESGRFEGYRAAGVNRVSLGVQALNDHDLRRLGRMHTAAEAMTAFDTARGIFERVSFDLIYARQDQTLTAWRAELAQALTLAVDHLSLYQLTIEDGTVFGARAAAGQLRGLPDDDLGADMYLMTQEMCAAAGMGGYEVSNHARDGSESRHNRIYWQSGDYVGVGPGAQGRLTLDGHRWGTSTPLAPIPWLRQVETMGAGEDAREAIDAHAHRTELLLMGLRLRDGIDTARLHANGIDTATTAITDLVDLGLIADDPDRLRVTDTGRPVLNGVLRAILADQSPVS
ncbi:oxygen-independent coproporphyrinogen-3 oxidase [Loktanella fryxellensis]|uniref:Heme chaperone HemW n=1 Tax=Loktanella fryxellensis TaxID=245187 RepID=A0A1H8DVV8_9RHOB|nr:radical SAM family heme chaperone HemW [Loktanella fryxellensis]SEN11439.1 oxygen-independent coproporphyrinogen-3 oxidase [Loktanella fryxellensis]